MCQFSESVLFSTSCSKEKFSFGAARKTEPYHEERFFKHSRLSLSRLRLSRITVYPKVKYLDPVLSWKSNNR